VFVGVRVINGGEVMLKLMNSIYCGLCRDTRVIDVGWPCPCGSIKYRTWVGR